MEGRFLIQLLNRQWGYSWRSYWKIRVSIIVIIVRDISRGKMSFSF